MSMPEPYTFLRIKRKRNEEPLDALVVESGVRRKKSRGASGIFKFAKTVEQGVWEDEDQKKAIQHQLSILAKQPALAESKTSTTTAATVPPPPKPHQPTDSRRYAIIEHSLPASNSPLRKPMNPPQIISAKELAAQQAKTDFKMYDAILENAPAQDQIDPALEKMLQDYLALEGSSTTIPSTSKDADYVWDIFYHRTGALTDAVAVGTVSGLPPLKSGDSDSDSYSEEEDEADEDSNAEEWYTNDYPEEEESDWSEDGQDDDEDEFHENFLDDEDVHDWR